MMKSQDKIVRIGNASGYFMLYDALDGGGTASMRMDLPGKGMGQMLLDMPIDVAEDLARSLNE